MWDQGTYLLSFHLGVDDSRILKKGSQSGTWLKNTVLKAGLEHFCLNPAWAQAFCLDSSIIFFSLHMEAENGINDHKVLQPFKNPAIFISLSDLLLAALHKYNVPFWFVLNVMSFTFSLQTEWKKHLNQFSMCCSVFCTPPSLILPFFHLSTLLLLSLFQNIVGVEGL